METLVAKKAMKLQGWLAEDEGFFLYFLASRLPAKGAVVEIGSFQGKSLIFLAQALKESTPALKVVSVDPHEGILGKDLRVGRTWSQLQHNLQSFGLEGQVTLLRKKSLEALQSWHKPIYLINIDGLHDYKSVKSDLQGWLKHLRIGGAVVCHDAFGASHPGVFKAIQESILDQNGYRYVGKVGTQIFAIKGKRKNIFEEINFKRSVWAITSGNFIWQKDRIPIWFRGLLVNVIIRPFLMNEFTFRAVLRRYLKLPIAQYPGHTFA